MGAHYITFAVKNYTCLCCIRSEKLYRYTGTLIHKNITSSETLVKWVFIMY
jgi:hypothetical protein